MDTSTSGTFDDPAKSFTPQNQEAQEFFTMVLRNICATFGNDATDLRDFRSMLRSGASCGRHFV